MIRRLVGDYLWLRAVRKHHSRLGWREAPKYTRYWRECQKVYKGPVTRVAAELFAQDHVAKFSGFVSPLVKTVLDFPSSKWDDEGRYDGDPIREFSEFGQLFSVPIGIFLRSVYRSHFAIYYGMIYRSVRDGVVPTGSQLWHADGGPGTCIIVMIYLTDVGEDDGPLQTLPWKNSLEIYRGERRALRGNADRLQQCGYFHREIYAHHADAIQTHTGPAGTIIAFSNNVLHRGGFPQPGHSRCVALFHCYPSMVATPYDTYRSVSLRKTRSYPLDPEVVHA